MPRIPALLATVLSLVCAASPAIGQTFQPKAIRFAGAPNYSDQDLLNTLHVTPGAVLSYAEMNAYAQKLVDSGMFSSVAFKFDGQDLIFQIAPASGLLPMRLRNLPFSGGNDLNEKLHRQFPLYHGVLPAQGGLTGEVREALEQMLAAQNIKATVAAATVDDPASHQPVALGFSIVSPAVLVGEIRTEGAVIALDPRASAIVAKYPGSLYDGETSLRQIEADFTTYYKDQGYPEPVVHASAGAKPVVTATALRIPLRVTIAPGVQYKLAGVQLAPGLLVSQADFDRRFPFRSGDTADGERLRAAWKFIDQQYHDHGFIKATVQPVSTVDRTARTVRYVVSVDPGPVYTMGKLTIDNVTDDLRNAMLSAWKMPTGSTFNESVISGFFSSHGVNPALEQAFSGADYHYTLTPDENTRTVDVRLTLEKKP
jgi:outer membrane protein assembly factor BamA